MATIETFKVNKGLKYLVKARKDGYYDHAQVFDGTEEDTSIELSAMTPYDGLSMTQVSGVESADTVDFTNTILPWKWDYEKYLSTSKFALMPVGNYAYFNYVPNGTVKGSLAVNDGILSGFSESNFFETSKVFNPASKPWEVVIKVRTGTDATSEQKIFRSCISAPTSAGKWGAVIEVYQGLFKFTIASNTSAWLFAQTGTYAVQPNTDYWVKAGWTGSEYYLDYALNGKDYIRDVTYASTSALYSGLTKTQLGIYSWDTTYTQPWLGTMDLNQSYIKIAGELFWSGVVKDATNNITFVGSPTFNTETMEVSNFSVNNYMTTPVFNPGNNPWEVRIKFTTGSEDMSNTSYKIFGSAKGDSTATRHGISLLIYKTNFDFAFSVDGSSWTYDVFGAYALQTNTTYWVKFGWTGAEYYLDYSTDGKVYNRDITISDSNLVYNTLSFTTLGGGYGGNKWASFNGSIDLSETELLINGETFYKPEVTYLTNTLQGCTHNYTDTGQATTLNCFTVNGDESVILTPDTSYNNERFLGTVNIAEHDVYDYVDGEWIEK